MHVLVVVVAQTEKLLHVLHARRRGPTANCLELGWISLNCTSTHNMAKVLDRPLKKCAFLQLGAKTCCPKTGEDRTQMSQVLRQGRTIHKDIIEVDDDKVI